MSGAVGLDPGTVRVGVAATDPTGVMAMPIGSWRCTDPQLWEKLRVLATERGADCFVVGLPRDMDGSEGSAARLAREFAQETRDKTGFPVEFWDERLTTRAAERALVSQGVRRQRRRAVVDAVAASIMLQGWLDGERNRRKPGSSSQS